MTSEEDLLLVELSHFSAVCCFPQTALVGLVDYPDDEEEEEEDDEEEQAPRKRPRLSS